MFKDRNTCKVTMLQMLSTHLLIKHVDNRRMYNSIKQLNNEQNNIYILNNSLNQGSHMLKFIFH